MAKRVWLFKKMNAVVYHHIEIRKGSARTEAGVLISEDSKIEGL